MYKNTNIGTQKHKHVNKTHLKEHKNISLKRAKKGNQQTIFLKKKKERKLLINEKFNKKIIFKKIRARV